MNVAHLRKVSLSISHDLVRWRRWFHQYPEVELECHNTAKRIVEELKATGINDIREGLAQSGLVATIRGKAPGPTVGIRFDMDALPVNESTGLPFESTCPGRAHACGHDGHMAIGLGVARVFTSLDTGFQGNIKLVFQPGEEYPGGAALMIRDGALENPKVDAMLGFHIFPGLEMGTFGLRYGVMTAQNDEFTVKIAGTGGHGGYPHQCRDPVAAAGTFITGVQNIVARQVSPIDSLVVTIGEICGGKGHNVIPGEVVLKGTVRSVSHVGRDTALKGLKKVADAADSLHGVRCELEIVEGEPPLRCSPELTDFARRVLIELVGEDHLTLIGAPSLGSDDFAFYSQVVPSTYLRIGCRARGYESPLHTPVFDFPEEILPDAVLAVASVALTITSVFQEKSP